MHIKITRSKCALGGKSEWTAEGFWGDDSLLRKGIGHTRADALDSLVRSNAEAFGIHQWTDINPLSSVPQTDWVTDMFTGFDPVAG